MTKRILVSDVGGTNGRFAIAEYLEGNTKPQIHSTYVLTCRNYPTFSDMLTDYLSIIKCDVPKIAHFAIAGEMTPTHGNLWHFNWDIKTEELKQTFGFQKAKLLNDYEALVKAVPYLNDDDLLTITPFKNGLKNAPFSVFGVGSGLGAAIGIPGKSGPETVPTEIGHISFAPKTEIEQELLNYMSDKINHVSIETFLSGPGLERIYTFLCGKKSKPSDPKSAPDITAAAADQSDEVCIQTVEIFLSILGSTTGDIAVAQGARGGVYIGGGIVPKIAKMISPEMFLKRLCDKGPMSDYVRKIPVHVIQTEMPALLGAAIINRDNW